MDGRRDGVVTEESENWLGEPNVKEGEVRCSKIKHRSVLKPSVVVISASIVADPGGEPVSIRPVLFLAGERARGTALCIRHRSFAAGQGFAAPSQVRAIRRAPPYHNLHAHIYTALCSESCQCFTMNDAHSARINAIIYKYKIRLYFK